MEPFAWSFTDAIATKGLCSASVRDGNFRSSLGVN